MSIIQTKLFRSVLPSRADSPDLAPIDQMYNTLEAEVNEFLATLNPFDVLDVQLPPVPVGKALIVHAWVTFRLR